MGPFRSRIVRLPKPVPLPRIKNEGGAQPAGFEGASVTGLSYLRHIATSFSENGWSPSIIREPKVRTRTHVFTDG